MARARGGDSNLAYAVATVLFAILFVFSLVLAIIFHMRWEGREDAIGAAEKALRTVILDTEQSTSNYARLLLRADDDKKTVYQVLNEDLADLKRLSVGSDDVDVAAVIEKYRRLDGQSLAGRLEQLEADLADKDAQKERLEAQMDEVRSEARASAAAAVGIGQAYEEAVKANDQRLTTVQADFVAHESANRQSLQKIEEDLTAKLGSSHRHVQQLQAQLNERQTHISKLEQAVRQLESIIKDPGIERVAPNIISHDGRIESLLPDEELVSIDLGRLDHVLPGLTFEVFDRNALLDLNQWASRGKATIEVVEVSDGASTARIVRLARGQQIMEQDKIYNIAYDKHWMPAFYVYGEFDIDQTGISTTTDRRRVETMIHQWRGQLKDELIYEVDFLVLGTAPVLPREPSSHVVDPAAIKRYLDQKQQYEHFQTLIQRAQLLKIPILNQNRFLQLVGYYQR